MQSGDFCACGVRGNLVGDGLSCCVWQWGAIFVCAELNGDFLCGVIIIVYN